MPNTDIIPVIAHTYIQPHCNSQPCVVTCDCCIHTYSPKLLLAWMHAGTPGATDAGEKWLFHGTTHQAVSTIVDQGFDPSKARSTCILGYGSYFAERSYTAMIYATPGYGGRSNSASAAPSSGTSGSYAVVPATTPPHPNHTQLVLAQVLLGKQGPGHNGITGAACAAAGYDTVNSPHSSDTMHVVFDADRIYPAYIIILKR